MEGKLRNPVPVMVTVMVPVTVPVSVVVTVMVMVVWVRGLDPARRRPRLASDPGVTQDHIARLQFPVTRYMAHGARPRAMAASRRLRCFFEVSTAHGTCVTYATAPYDPGPALRGST